MAATDKFFRDQYKLDMVFALTSIAMLVSVVMMLAQDHYREYKVEQRIFRDVEAKLAQRMAIEQIPSEEEMDAAESAVEEARKERAKPEVMKQVAALQAEIAAKLPKKEKAEAIPLDLNASFGSKVSFYNIAVEHHGPDSDHAKHLMKEIDDLRTKLADADAVSYALTTEVKELNQKLVAFDQDLTKKTIHLKKLNDKFDAGVKQAINKEWGWGDWIRGLWVIDGYASPTKIHQITNNEYGINYNFKDATRYDRCMTCHLGIERPAYTKDALESLVKTTPEQRGSLAYARQRLEKRRKLLSGLPDADAVANPKNLKLGTIDDKKLTEARINQYAVHPRLDLFGSATSKHSFEKFGCTPCHNGQGSSTSFQWASHTPNDELGKKKWEKEFQWNHIHAGDWEFPMTQKRFTESNCLKCHHQVTDLIGADHRNEAPKLMRGYNLIRENGCFGCHEITGRKGGRDVGPDMRLESTPPLEDLTPTERVKIESDLDNRPGNLRKVGPSLYRWSEKSNHDFTVKWLRSPRDFRPDTKMPHFYGLSNNDPATLPDDQKAFPEAEIHAISHYLMATSKTFLADAKARQTDGAEAAKNDQDAVTALIAKGKLGDDDKKTLDQTQRRIRLRAAKTLADVTGGATGDAKKGRHLFIERGCLACHSHQATEKAEEGSPAIVGEAQFGPNLSQIGEKFGTNKGDKASSMLWLTQWIMDPQVHSPRSRMPITHLSGAEAADLAAWLLAQPAADLGSKWKSLEVKPGDKETLENLARVYLTRLISRSDLKKFFEEQAVSEQIAKDLPADDRAFVENYKAGGDHAIQMYVGKKAISRQGCYACHDIPGFDGARPIGVGLADWGKKDGSKLAFEDIANFFKENYYKVDKMVDADGKPHKPKAVKTEDGKETIKQPYETMFAEALHHEMREGYLHQKLVEPRSYDHNRLRAWDDRSRMPQFRFSRMRQKTGESDGDFGARANKEEAEAREAVMTFVLGLVGEPVPLKMINQPTGDRLAEVKGRQVLDKFNCAGCHLVRPGVFEFKFGEQTLKSLGETAKRKMPADHVFLSHQNFTGKTPANPDLASAQGILPQPAAPADDESSEDGLVRVRLSHALRFQGDDKVLYDIPAAVSVGVDPKDFVYPPRDVFESPEAMKLFLKDRGQYGGTFADLLVGYLIAKDKKTFTRDPGTGDSSRARPLAPPSLIGQGERTQPEWLYQFLLNPTQVRRMTLLRMPKFNMSETEARALVDYFAAVERQNNTGVRQSYPFETMEQQASEGYWSKKSAEYVARLKSTKVKVGDKEATMFDRRVEELTPIWKTVLKDYEARKTAAEAKLELVAPRLKEAEAKEKSAKSALDDATKAKKDAKELADLDAKHKLAKADLDAATKLNEAWDREAKDLGVKIAASGIEKQKQTWMEKEAYVTDAYRLVVNKTLCLQCHTIGNLEVKNDILGPPLTLAHSRLRPGWTERWIANPPRFLPYSSSMPNNFPADAPAQNQEFFAGTPAERVQAVRDLLMILPQASAMPANRYWVLPLPDGKGQ